MVSTKLLDPRYPKREELLEMNHRHEWCLVAPRHGRGPILAPWTSPIGLAAARSGPRRWSTVNGSGGDEGGLGNGQPAGCCWVRVIELGPPGLMPSRKPRLIRLMIGLLIEQLNFQIQDGLWVWVFANDWAVRLAIQSLKFQMLSWLRVPSSKCLSFIFFLNYVSFSMNSPASQGRGWSPSKTPLGTNKNNQPRTLSLFMATDFCVQQTLRFWAARSQLRLWT